MIINHNVLATNAQRQYNIIGNAKKKNIEKLSSGYRINRAADDSAGLAISEKMRRQIRGLTQGIKNTEEGVSLCQVADGALSEVDDMLHRMTELSIKAANGTNTDIDREYIQQEITALKTEIDRIGLTTSFNERLLFTEPAIIDNSVTVTYDEALTKVLNGTAFFSSDIIDNNDNTVISKEAVNLIYSSYHVLNQISQLNTDLENGIRLVDNKAKTASTFKSLNNLLVEYSNIYGLDTSKVHEHIDVINTYWDDFLRETTYSSRFTYIEPSMAFYANKAGAAYSSDDVLYGINPSLNNIFRGSKGQSSLFCAYNLACATVYSALYKASLQGTIDNYGSYDSEEIIAINRSMYNLKRAMETLADDYIQDSSSPYATYLSNPSDAHSLALIYSYANSTEDIQFEDRRIWIQSGVEPGQGMYLTIDSMNTNVLGIAGIDVSTQTGAESAIGKINTALQKVSDNRSKIGAQQNRLMHTINNENNIVENTAAAESRIRDADMAKEMVDSALINVLQQAGISAISQANQSNQGVLKLLQ